jgi:hypothetical protein
MKREIQAAAWAAAGVIVSALSVQAVPVGSDTFAYPDGPIDNRAGGTGWAYERQDEPGAAPSAPSDWDGAANVVGGRLVTLENVALRQYNGPSEGSVVPSNEREGALQSTGSVFYAFDMTRQAGASWSGASSFDFGAERIFFGVPGQPAPNSFFGIEESGVGQTFSTIPAVAGQTYRVVAELDFDTDQLNLWVNPTAGEELTPDATRAYTGTNWSTAVRLGSGGTGSTSWDNLVVGTAWADVVPEPSTLWLGGIGAMALLRRRR